MPSRQSLKFFVCTRHLANQAKAMFVFTIMASSSSILSFPANHQQALLWQTPAATQSAVKSSKVGPESPEERRVYQSNVNLSFGGTQAISSSFHYNPNITAILPQYPSSLQKRPHGLSKSC